MPFSSYRFLLLEKILVGTFNMRCTTRISALPVLALPTVLQWPRLYSHLEVVCIAIQMILKCIMCLNQERIRKWYCISPRLTLESSGDGWGRTNWNAIAIKQNLLLLEHHQHWRRSKHHPFKLAIMSPIWLHVNKTLVLILMLYWRWMIRFNMYVNQIRKLQGYLTEDQFKTLIRAYVTSNLDTKNGLLCGAYKYIITMLQLVQNAAEIVICVLKKLIMQLHCYSIFIDSKWQTASSLVLPTGESPKYLKDLRPHRAHPKDLTVELQSSDDPTLSDTPGTNKITYGSVVKADVPIELDSSGGRWILLDACFSRSAARRLIFLTLNNVVKSPCGRLDDRRRETVRPPDDSSWNDQIFGRCPAGVNATIVRSPGGDHRESCRSPLDDNESCSHRLFTFWWLCCHHREPHWSPLGSILKLIF